MKGPTLLWELALHSGMPSHRNVSKSQFDPVSSSCSHSRILSAVSQGLRRRDTTPTFSMDSSPTNQGQPPTSHGCFQDIFTLEWAHGGQRSPFSLFREAQGRNSTGAPTSPPPLPLSPGSPFWLFSEQTAVRNHLPPGRLFPGCVRGQSPPAWVGPQGRGPGGGLPRTGLQSWWLVQTQRSCKDLYPGWTGQRWRSGEDREPFLRLGTYSQFSATCVLFPLAVAL